MPGHTGGHSKDKNKGGGGAGGTGGSGATDGGSKSKGRKSSKVSQKSTKQKNQIKSGNNIKTSTGSLKSSTGLVTRGPNYKSPNKTLSTLDKKKIRSPEAFSPQDVAAALGRKAEVEANTGKYSSRNEAYKANQPAVDAQKARFSGYSPSKRSDTSGIAGFGGINAKNLGLGVQAAYNRALGRNETTGMGILDSLRFQGTRPDFKGDLVSLQKNLGKLPTPINLLRKIASGIMGKVNSPRGMEGLAQQYSQPVRDLLNTDAPISNMPMFNVNPGVRPVDPFNPTRGLIFENTSPVARPNIVDPDTGIPGRTEDQSMVNRLMGEILSET